MSFRKRLARTILRPIAVRCNLARAFLDLGDPADAIAFATAALDAHERHLGPNRPPTKDSAHVTCSRPRRTRPHRRGKAVRENGHVIEGDRGTVFCRMPVIVAHEVVSNTLLG
jgi:hypothetical protein